MFVGCFIVVREYFGNPQARSESITDSVEEHFTNVELEIDRAVLYI